MDRASAQIGALLSGVFDDDDGQNKRSHTAEGSLAADQFGALLLHALGVAKERPDTSALGIHADRFTGFVQRFMDRRGLQVAPKQVASQPTEPQTPALKADPKPAPIVDQAKGYDQWMATRTRAEAAEKQGEEDAAALAAEARERETIARNLGGADSGLAKMALNLDAHNERERAKSKTRLAGMRAGMDAFFRKLHGLGK